MEIFANITRPRLILLADGGRTEPRVRTRTATVRKRSVGRRLDLLRSTLLSTFIHSISNNRELVITCYYLLLLTSTCIAINMFLSTAFVPLVLIALIGDATGLRLSTFDRLTASEQLEAAFHARRMAPSEADQKCIDESRAMWGGCNCDKDGNVTESTETKLSIAWDEAMDQLQCDGWFEEFSFRNITIDEGTVNETTVEVIESVHAEADLVGCDHLPLWEEECTNAGGFVESVPDLDLHCRVPDDAPPQAAGLVYTSSLRNLYECFAPSCESTVQKLQSGVFDDILGLGTLAGPLAAFAECEITLVDDQVPDDTSTSSAISMTVNSFRVGGIFLSLVALMMI